MDREDQLVKRVWQAISPAGSSPKRLHEAKASLKLGIGDDATVIRPNGRTDWVLSCDAFLEGVHFLGSRYPPDSVGYKSLVRATSDLAAMGATPRFFLLTLALPSNRTGAWLNGFLRGMRRAARTLGIRLIGGDTSKFPRVSISITVLGEMAPGKAIKRSGARRGDTIYVSGKLGRAQLGLELVRRGLGRRKNLAGLMQRHLYPTIRLELASWLAEHQIASAMMDLSDGLSTDLPRLCAASGVGARLWSDCIPRVDVAGVPLRASRIKLDPLGMALHGGEDYELLFTVPAPHLKQLKKAPGFRELTAVGEITRDKTIALMGEDGTSRPLESRGWDPFRKDVRQTS